MKKYKITTLGCKVNQYESEAIGRELETSQWDSAGRTDPADLCIINTCTVTQKASMQSRQAVRQAIRANPKARIVVTGCYAQTAAEELSKIKGVDYVIGHSQKHTIASMFDAAEETTEVLPGAICSDVLKDHQFHQYSQAAYGTRTRPFMKIQDGCDAFCSYCIVPYARGPSRSMPLADVLAHIGQLGDNGYHEVVLTGVHLGNYGLDLKPKTSLFALLCRIDEDGLITRIRLSSIEPLELSNDIIKRVSTSPRFCRHFHIPLQSGDDVILKNMRRPYTRNYFHDLVLKINQSMPDAAVGVDILVGFPGETDAAFENTYNLIRALPVAYLHVFPFSERPGTPASKFLDKVPAKVIKKRCDRMRRLGTEKRKAFYQKFRGQTLDVLIEETTDRSTGFLKGVSSNYLPVLIDAPKNHVNTVVAVKIDKLDTDNRLFGAIQHRQS
jgi:threonylcarbamoyladenosine tRNA methylthiotransferase MtaB